MNIFFHKILISKKKLPHKKKSITKKNHHKSFLSQMSAQFFHHKYFGITNQPSSRLLELLKAAKIESLWKTKLSGTFGPIYRGCRHILGKMD